jgi:hypothetical protein
MIIVGALDDIGSGAPACVDPSPRVEPQNWEAIRHRARLFQGFSPDILPTAANSLGGLFDFALIDGDHSTAGVSRDAEGILPLMEDSAYLLFHDAYHAPVSIGISELLRNHGRYIVDCGLISTQRTPVRTRRCFGAA